MHLEMISFLAYLDLHIIHVGMDAERKVAGQGPGSGSPRDERHLGLVV